MHQKLEKGIYHTEYPSQSHIPLKIHKQPPPPVDQNKIYATKSDIRMGIGGIKGIFKGSNNNSNSSNHHHHHNVNSAQNNHYGPPKPPRTLEGDNVPVPPNSKSFYTDPRMTNSLERESRSDKRWNGHR